MAQMGRPKTDNPRGTRITIRLTDDEMNELKKCAAKEKITVAEYIRRKAVTKALRD